MPTTNRKLRVFICHASQDKPIVRELYNRLFAEDWIDPWLDEEKLLPGQNWDIEIEKAVEVAEAVVVCLSINSVTKEGYVQKELRFVLNIADEKPEGTVFVIPLQFDNCQVPRRLKEWQYVDYFPEARKSKSYERLVESLRLRKAKLDVQNAVHKRSRKTDYAVRRAKTIDLVKKNKVVDPEIVAAELNITRYQAIRLLDSLENEGCLLTRKYDSAARPIYSMRIDKMKASKDNVLLADGTKFEWVDKKVTRVGKRKISEINYVAPKKRQEDEDEN